MQTLMTAAEHPKVGLVAIPENMADIYERGPEWKVRRLVDQADVQQVESAAKRLAFSVVEVRKVLHKLDTDLTMTKAATIEQMRDLLFSVQVEQALTELGQ